MTKKELISDFLSRRKLALVGMSRKRNKFGNAVFKDLRSKGYEVFPVHPEAGTIEGVRCWSSLADLPTEVDGLVVCVPPPETEKVVREARAAGITRVWMQQGAESPEAARYCDEQGMSLVQNECVMMHAQPIRSIHLVHRWVARLVGKLPK